MTKTTIKLVRLILNVSYVIDNTTEHLFECPILQRLTQEEMKAINFESVDSMQQLRQIARYIEQVNETKHEMT